MPDCPRIGDCPFFADRLNNMPVLAEQMKKKYCKGDNSNCARHIVASKLGRELVPADLFPAHTDRAQKLIHGH